MTSRRSPRWMARRARLLALAPLVALLALAACGTHGNAPPLARGATVALVGAAGGQSLGSASFTSVYAAHIVTYYKGKLIPFKGAQMPVELRDGSCTGKTLAALTEATSAPIPGGLAVAPDAQSGVDVAVTTSANLFVVVRQQANDASAPLLACGDPLSGQKQYFNLFTPAEGSNGYSLGMALMEPILATRVNVTLASPTAGATTWAVRAGSCSTAPLTQGQIAAGAKDASGEIFSALDAAHWRLTLADTGGAQTLCQPVG
jgi:hypothetical protein